jgi:hypothetical protein
MDRRTYNLEPRDTTGVFLGLSTGELALVGTGFVAAVVARLAGFPAPVCAVPLLVGFGLAKLRVAGQPLREWVPLLARWATTSTSGGRQWFAPLPLFPTGDEAELPPVLRGLEVVEVPALDHAGAIVCDRRAGRATVVMTVAGSQFACQDPAAQDALLAAWGTALATNATAGNPVVQVGWSDAARPSSLAGHRQWASAQLGDLDGMVGDPDGYHDLVEEMSGLAAGHEAVVWLTVSRTQAWGGGRAKALDHALAHLPAAVDNLIAALTNAGLRTDGPLPVPGLWRLLRSRIDPTDATTCSSTDGFSLAEHLRVVGARSGGPLAISTAWSQLRTDASFHRTWWVETWPRSPLPGDWLQGFLTAGESWTMTVAFRPINPERSRKRIESQAKKHAANRAIKAERDRRLTEDDQRAEDALAELEADLASGYAEMLYLGLVTVAAPTIDDLDAAGRCVEQAGRNHGMSLRVLHGRQDIAWAATLPFGLADPSVLDLVGV